MGFSDRKIGLNKLNMNKKIEILRKNILVLRIISFAIAFRLGKLDILSPPCCIIISITDS